MTGCGKEIADLTKMSIFNIIDVLKDLTPRDLLFLMWVFKYKTDSDGFITKYKSRFVVRGDL